MRLPPFSGKTAVAINVVGARAPLAYIGGTLGVLIGADLMRLSGISAGAGVAFASIGSGGTFDGVFLTGMLAVPLA